MKGYIQKFENKEFYVIFNNYIFQAFTGIENLDECIELLNQHDWDLMVQ